MVVLSSIHKLSIWLEIGVGIVKPKQTQMAQNVGKNVKHTQNVSLIHKAGGVC